MCLLISCLSPLLFFDRLVQAFEDNALLWLLGGVYTLFHYFSHNHKNQKSKKFCFPNFFFFLLSLSFFLSKIKNIKNIFSCLSFLFPFFLLFFAFYFLFFKIEKIYKARSIALHARKKCCRN